MDVAMSFKYKKLHETSAQILGLSNPFNEVVGSTIIGIPMHVEDGSSKD